MKDFVIFYDGYPICILKGLPEFTSVVETLSAYSDFSGFEYSKLTYDWISTLNFNEMRIN